MRWWGCEAVRWRIGEWVRLWVGEVVNWWGCEAVRIWSCKDVRWRIGKWVRSCVGEVVNWWGCGLVKLWVGELMYSGVIGPSWVYKPVGPSALHFVYVRRLYLVSAQETRLNCLNPCCNGWCTRTYGIFDHRPWNLGVLILVIMDDALARVRLLACSYWTRRVLILVVMDDTLAHTTPLFSEVVEKS